jgi:hypothetical protein
MTRENFQDRCDSGHRKYRIKIDHTFSQLEKSERHISVLAQLTLSVHLPEFDSKMSLYMSSDKKFYCNI